jgi:hypothetical protein
MNKLEELIKTKADSISTKTEINRRAKGCYVNCLLMAKGYNAFLLSQLAALFNHMEHIDDEVGSKMVEELIETIKPTK